MDGFDRLRDDARIDGPHAQHRRPSENRVQRRAELVGNGRYELVLQFVGCLRFRARAFRLLVEARAIERLRAVLCDRDEQGLIVVIEIHGSAEVEFEHAEGRAFDEQRQRRGRRKSLVGGKRRRAPGTSPASR